MSKSHRHNDPQEPCPDCGNPTAYEILASYDGVCSQCLDTRAAREQREADLEQREEAACEARAEQEWLTSHAGDTYHAVVESGSCSQDYLRWEERLVCGHAHRTHSAAEKCLADKQRWRCDHGRLAGLACRYCVGGMAQAKQTSATWYNGTIHNQDGERA